MAKVLVVANETLGGKALIDAVLPRAEKGDRFVVVVPATRPRHGDIIYLESVQDAAQVRIDLATSFMTEHGVQIEGEVGDPDPFHAAMDAVREHQPSEIIVSTHPETRSGWLRKDLVQHLRDESGLPVHHVITDLQAEGLPFSVTLVIANQTVGGEALSERLQAKAQQSQEEGRQSVFIVVIPQKGGHGTHVSEARRRLRGTLRDLRKEGLLAAGMIADPDPYTATMNALHTFHVDDVVISTLPETRSGWMRSDLIKRLQGATPLPVEHVVVDLEAEKAEAR
ncbi:MAG TPA: hypothetical protein VHR88_03700 [Solirubrobacteraceae bacterium]|jgi:hypothetical protein|nr:hypothetical protein [Solirubrobacteraceae bacterium]